MNLRSAIPGWLGTAVLAASPLRAESESSTELSATNTVPIARSAVPADSSAESLVWAAPESLILIDDWAAGTAGRPVSGSGTITLREAQILLVPVERGQWVQIESEPLTPQLQLGFASGASTPPDTIVWEPVGVTRIYVPTWLRASHVAIRSPSTATFAVNISARAVTPVDWFLWDSAMSAWARTGAKLPEVPSEGVRRILHALEILRDALPLSERARAAPMLLGLWLEESLRTRPLSRPFFKQVTPNTEAIPSQMVGPTRKSFRLPPADVHRWQLRAKGPTRLIIREDGAIARVINWSNLGEDATGWSALKSIRTIAGPGDSATELEVVEGTVSISMQASAFRPEYREIFGPVRRQRDALRAEGAKAHDTLDRSVAVVNAYLNYTASTKSDSLDEAISQAMSGLQVAQDPAWQALFAQRLLDLAIDDEPLDARLAYKRKALGTTVPRNDAVLRRALNETVAPSRLGRRPALGENLEAWSRASPSDTLIQRAATKYWEAFPYRSIAAPATVATRATLVPLERQGFCNPVREGLQGWLVPAEGATDFSIDLDAGVYAIATLRPLDETPQPEGLIQIDGTSIAIHAAAGLSSRAALGRGAHRIQRLANSPRFAVEATEGMTLPCSKVYRWQHVTPLLPDNEVRFELSSPGTTSVVRLRFGAQSIPTRLWVTLGNRRYEVALRPPASGSVELAVGADDDAISIRSNAEVSVAVALRRELEPLPKPVSLPLSSVVPSSVSGTAPPSIAQALLLALEDVGRRLRATTEESTRTQLRDERARLLIRAGFSSLALRDIGELPRVADTPSDLVRLDGATANVLPVGLISAIGPLPMPSDPRNLLSRRKALQTSDTPTCALQLEQLSQSPPNAETLLASYCAERSGLSQAAAGLFERIARATSHGPSMLHAALLMTDAAVEAQDRRLSLRAALLGTWATKWGAEASALRARLAAAIEWVTPSIFDGAAGVTWLAHGLTALPSPRQQLLARLIDAPNQALVIASDEFAELLVNSDGTDSLEVASGCDTALDVDQCSLSAWLDNEPVFCTNPGPSHRCRLPVPAGKHRIRFGFEGTGTLGWLTARLGRQALAPIIASSWSVLDAGSPARLTIKGPTIIRLRSRGSGIDGESIAITGCDLDEAYSELKLPTGTDAQSRPWPTSANITPVGSALEVSIPVPGDKRCSLSIVARQAHTLLQVALARASGLPTPRLLPVQANGAAAILPVSASPAAIPRSADAVPRSIAERQPLLVGARSRFVSESLAVALETDSASSSGEGAFQDVFGEVSAIAARELVASRWWGTLQAGARFRNGPTTEFARVAFDLPPQIGLPGVDLVGSVYSQSSSEARTTTYATTGKLSRLWAVTPSMNVLPQISFTTMHVGRAPAVAAGVDGDVYSHFYATHPRYASLATAIALRPFVDTLANLSLSARSLPQLDGIDRVTATLELLALPVTQWPILGGIDWMSSYRPSSSLRSEMFVRHDLGIAFSFWNWLTPNERLRCFGRVDFFFDAPAANFDTVIIAPTIGLELMSSGSRGLRDLSPRQAPFKEFQERGSARVHTGRVGELDESLASGAIP